MLWAEGAEAAVLRICHQGENGSQTLRWPHTYLIHRHWSLGPPPLIALRLWVSLGPSRMRT